MCGWGQGYSADMDMDGGQRFGWEDIHKPRVARVTGKNYLSFLVFGDKGVGLGYQVWFGICGFGIL